MTGEGKLSEWIKRRRGSITPSAMEYIVREIKAMEARADLVPRVKDLQWEETGDDVMIARTVMGSYVYENTDGLSQVLFKGFEGAEIIGSEIGQFASDCIAIAQAHYNALILGALDMVEQWQPIETAPKDGTPILFYCEEIGEPILVRWCAPVEFLTEGEIASYNLDDEWEHENDWFYADFCQGGRYMNDISDGGKILWMPLPTPPTDTEGA